MNLLYFIIWYLFGLVGCIIICLAIKLENKYIFNEDIEWCPAPLDILGAAVCSFIGPILFLASLIIALILWLGRINDSDSWWITPVCRKKYPFKAPRKPV